MLRHHSDPPEPFPHNEEPQLRKLGLTTSLTKGVPTLTAPHQLCQEGKTLTSEHAQLLKLTGIKMVTFRVRLLSRWDAMSGDVIQIKEGSATEETPDEDTEMCE